MASLGQIHGLPLDEKQLLRLVELSVTLNSTLELDALLQQITATAAELLDCEGASILLYDEKNPRLYFAAATGADPAKLAEIPVPMEGSIAGTIFRTNQPLIQNHTEQDPRHFVQVSDHIKFKTRTLLGVPMPIKDRTVGVLEAVNKNNGVFTESDVALLSVIAAHAAIAINNARLLQATRQALRQVREMDEIKNNFLSLASHELRTPLGIIMGYSTFLKEDTKDEASILVDRVLVAARQMRSILDEMSNLTMLKADTMDLSPQRVPLQDVLTFACEGIRELASTKDQTLEFIFPEEPLYVNIDLDRTSMAFINLLTNAANFSHQGSAITIGMSAQGDNVLAWVKDQGVGIPADKLEKIFDEFYQIEPPNTRSYGGLGIGLSIARGLIEMQGGKVWAESDGPGQGATLKVILPKAE
jgi:signal transduction histidine kinase